MAYFVADTGGTTIRVEGYRALDPSTRFGRSTFPVSKDFEADYSRLIRTCQKLADGEPIDAFCLAVAGRVSSDHNFILGAGNLIHWVGRPVAKMLQRDLSCRAVITNDAASAALAEAVYGWGAGLDFWFWIWGTGVGGTLVRRVDGKPVAFPSEVGHQIVIPDTDGESECGCGRSGCLESLTSGRSLSRFGASPSDLTTEQWDEVVEWMSTGVYNALVTQPTNQVIFGGGVAAKQPHLLPQIQRRLREMGGIIDPPIVRLAAFGEESGTLGALALLSQDE